MLQDPEKDKESQTGVTSSADLALASSWSQRRISDVFMAFIVLLYLYFHFYISVSLNFVNIFKLSVIQSFKVCL